MIALTQKDVLAHEAVVPWSEPYQVERERFIEHLRECLADRAGFCTDLVSVLRRDLTYDPDVAGAFIERDLLGLLPE